MIKYTTHMKISVNADRCVQWQLGDTLLTIAAS